MTKHLKKEETATNPSQGWPWPWLNSQTTDYAYAFRRNEKAVYAAYFGEAWYKPLTETKPNVAVGQRRITFPNMKHIQNVTWGVRSGVMIYGHVPKEKPAKTKPARSKA